MEERCESKRDPGEVVLKGMRPVRYRKTKELLGIQNMRGVLRNNKRKKKKNFKITITTIKKKIKREVLRRESVVPS